MFFSQGVPVVDQNDFQPPKKPQQLVAVTFNYANSLKGSYLRDLVQLKTLMDKRIQQRGLTLFYLANAKYQNALIYCRQLTFSSTKIYKQYLDDYNHEFEQTYFYRTSKSKEHLEYLLDCLIACKVFLQSKKRQDAIDVLQKVQINPDQIEPKFQILKEQDKIRFNQKHEIMSKMCSILLSFIDFAKQEKLSDYCQKFFNIYVKYVRNNYGVVEESTALFKYGCYLYQTKNYQKAQEVYKICVALRTRNVINSCLVDALINLSICQKELYKYQDAMNNTKYAIQIYKDTKIDDDTIDKYYLFLGKLCMESGNFDQAYKNFMKCYQMRAKLSVDSPAKIEIQINLMIFYKVLRDIIEKPKDNIINIEDKKVVDQRKKQAREVIRDIKINILQREQFSKYRDFKSSKFSHLSLFISKQFFDSLSSKQVIELTQLMNQLNDLTYNRGFAELQKCSFWEEKKIRDLLIQGNGNLKKGASAKKTSSEVGSSRVG